MNNKFIICNKLEYHKIIKEIACNKKQIDFIIQLLVLQTEYSSPEFPKKKCKVGGLQLESNLLDIIINSKITVVTGNINTIKGSYITMLI